VRPSLALHEPTEEAAEADEPIELAVLRWQMAAALERLTPEHRQVIRLAHFQGYTLREISEQTGLPLGTVKSRASYAPAGTPAGPRGDGGPAVIRALRCATAASFSAATCCTRSTPTRPTPCAPTCCTATVAPPARAS